MSSLQPFHIRKTVNAFLRSGIFLQTSKRDLSITPRHESHDTVSIDEEPLTAHDTLRYLQYHDQTKLQETHSALNKYLRSVRALQTFMHDQTSLRISSDQKLPAYHLTSMRATARLVDETKAELFEHGMKLKEHLTDLQHEPYQEDMDEQLHAWEREIALKDDFEVLDMYQSSDLEDAATVNRLRKQVDALVKRVNIATGRPSELNEEQYPGLVADPFAKQTERESLKPGTRSQDWGSSKRQQVEVSTARESNPFASDSQRPQSTSSEPGDPAKSEPAKSEPEISDRTSAGRIRHVRTLKFRKMPGEGKSRDRPGRAAATLSPSADSQLPPPSSMVATPAVAATSSAGTSLTARRRSLAEEQQRLEMDMQRSQEGREGR